MAGKIGVRQDISKGRGVLSGRPSVKPGMIRGGGGGFARPTVSKPAVIRGGEKGTFSRVR